MTGITEEVLLAKVSAIIESAEEEATETTTVAEMLVTIAILAYLTGIKDGTN